MAAVCRSVIIEPSFHNCPTTLEVSLTNMLVNSRLLQELHAVCLLLCLWSHANLSTELPIVVTQLWRYPCQLVVGDFFVTVSMRTAGTADITSPAAARKNKRGDQ